MIAVFVGLALAPDPGHGREDAPSTHGAVYVRTDSDHTTVVSPRVRGRYASPRTGTGVDIVYAADVWTSASVDIRTAATARVTEQRDELDVGVDQALADDHLTLGLGYRMSYEPDYLSNAISASARLEALQRNLTVEARGFVSLDRVGRSGDALFNERSLAAGGWIGVTQLLDRATILQLAGELRGVSGYQASPYRFVAIDGAGRCGPEASLCVPEVHPARRLRVALVARARRALHPRTSIGLGYRFYVDTWAIQSHTPTADVAVQAARGLWLWLRYRGYFQSGARFYRARYGPGDDLRYVTRDRELSSMFSHRLELTPRYTRSLGAQALEAGLLVAGALLGYDDFIGLDRVYALELSAHLGLSF
ncbi:MAG: DUF3570 domain-containing protein [Nannocystaceae bacterium]